MEGKERNKEKKGDIYSASRSASLHIYEECGKLAGYSIKHVVGQLHLSREIGNATDFTFRREQPPWEGP